MAKHSPSSTIALALLLLVLLEVSTAVSGLGGGMVGGRKKVQDVKRNNEVQELGRYSVEQYNRQQRQGKGQNGGGPGDLTFQQVVEAETQVVSGIKYYLKISAVTRKGGVPMTFDAVVVVKPWAHSKELLNFSPSPSSPATK